jgi:hypothetical protein
MLRKQCKCDNTSSLGYFTQITEGAVARLKYHNGLKCDKCGKPWDYYHPNTNKTYRKE